MRKLAIIFLCGLSSLAQAQFITNTGIQITNTASVYTNGDWQNSGSFLNNGTITTSEAWQNTGTLDVNSVGGFVLQYTISKDFSAGTNAAKIGFLQKEGAGDVTVSGTLSVTDSFKIQSGLIRMSTSADTLGISSTTLVTVANGSYVEGPMARFGSGTFLFPVGRAGQYLPIRFFNSNSTRVGVVVEDAPAGYLAGEAVESLSTFPYAWRTVTAQPTDTASYLEVELPDALAVGIVNPIIVQKVNLVNEFEGMGSRLVSSDGTSTTIRSYSSGLGGLFTIANGYAGNMLGDSTELVAFHDATDGSNWTNSTNWKATNVGSWFGVVEKGGRVTRIEMPGNNIIGPVPSTIVNMQALKVFDVGSNAITSVPDFTTIPAISTLDVSGNSLDFGSLESNATLIGQGVGVNYVNQALVSTTSYNEIPVSSDTTMIIPVGGINNVYQWKFKSKTDLDYSNVGTNSGTHIIGSIDRSTMGDYMLEITNPTVPGLLLMSAVHSVAATADISGTLFASSATPVTSGTMRLLRVTPTGSYDTVGIEAVSGSGTFLFDNKVLDDYLVNGYADTLVTAYVKALPTYFEKTIFWEEADTLVLEDNINLDITSEFKPDPPTTGQGEITGTFYENVGGRTSAKARVSKASVTVRRVQGGGRGKDEVLTLVAQTFTDDNGEFTFTKLDEAEYRLNIQLPGYPMDENSFITIPIVNNLFERHVGVEAEVIDGKIEVRKLVITGWQEEVHAFSVYPNPTIDFLYLKGKGVNRNLQFQLTDTAGKSVNAPVTWDGEKQQWEVNIKGFQRGMYFLQVRKNGKSETLQVLIQ